MSDSPLMRAVLVFALSGGPTGATAYAETQLPVCAAGGFALRADAALLGVSPGDAIEVHSARPGSGSPVEAIPGLTLGLDPCDGTARPAAVGDGTGRYRLTVPKLPPGAQRACIVPFCAGERVFDPPSIGFCPGDVSLERCFPAWYAAYCIEQGKPIARSTCHARAKAANKMGAPPNGRLFWKPPRGRRRAVQGTRGAGCPTLHPQHGIIFARGGDLLRVPWSTAQMKRGDAVLRPERFAAGELHLSSPQVAGDGALIAVGRAADGARWLVRVESGPKTVVHRIRRLPRAAGRVGGIFAGIALMTSGDGPTGIDVPLDPDAPILASQRPPPDGCFVRAGGHIFDVR